MSREPTSQRQPQQPQITPILGYGARSAGCPDDPSFAAPRTRPLSHLSHALARREDVRRKGIVRQLLPHLVGQPLKHPSGWGRSS
jgi:hypothetical protein